MKEKNETVEFLKSKSKEEVLDFIRKKLAFSYDILSCIRYQIEPDKEHWRFEMSGYGDDVTSFNQKVLNTFEYLGIYDYTAYFVLDFYKGSPYIYLKYWNDHQPIEIDELSGLGTCDIIYKIFELTIFSGKQKRRRV